MADGLEAVAETLAPICTSSRAVKTKDEAALVDNAVFPLGKQLRPKLTARMGEGATFLAQATPRLTAGMAMGGRGRRGSSMRSSTSKPDALER